MKIKKTCKNGGAVRMRNKDSTSNVKTNFVLKQPMRNNLLKYMGENKLLYLMLVPGFAFFILFNYVPMYGIIIAFKEFNFAKGIWGSDWNNFKHFKMLFQDNSFVTVLFNSIYLSLLRLAINFPIPIILALMLNEIKCSKFKKLTQTMVYLPYFISWVILGGIAINFLSINDGLINEVIKTLGFEPISFMGGDKYFRPLIVITSIWKEAGWGSILYLAAITNINPELYEAVTVDGANRIRQLWHITLPGIKSTIIVLFIIGVGRIMTNGFEQVYIFQNGSNKNVSDIIETFTMRVGLENSSYSFATAVGLFQSVVGVILLTFTNKLAKILGERALY